MQTEVIKNHSSYQQLNTESLQTIKIYCLSNDRTILLKYCGAAVTFDGTKIHSVINGWNLDVDGVRPNKLEILISIYTGLVK